jgi:cell division protease FtsH
MEEAVDRVYAGPERKSRTVAERDRLTAAYHEVGHAITARMLSYTDPVQKLTIVPRGRAGGYTRTVHEEGYEPQYATAHQLRDLIAFAMGGHMAEDAFFGEVSSGASNDIARATEIARRMVLQYGMSKRLGPLAWGKSNGGDVPQSNFSKKMAYTIDLEIRRMLEEGKERSRAIIAENRDKLAEIAEALLLTESMSGAEFEAFFTSPRPKPVLEWPQGSLKPQPTA